MHPFKTFFTKRKIKKIDAELKGVDTCINYWSNGVMGYTQAPEELEELEKQETELTEKRKKLYNDLEGNK